MPLHVAMRDARIHVGRAKGDKAQTLVKAQRMGLRAQHRARHPRLPAQVIEAGADQRRTKPRAARLPQDADAADLGALALYQDTRTADRAAIQPRQQMLRLAVAPVLLVGLTDALFLDEDAAAQRRTGVQIKGRADLDLARDPWRPVRHAK